MLKIAFEREFSADVSEFTLYKFRRVLKFLVDSRKF